MMKPPQHRSPTQKSSHVGPSKGAKQEEEQAKDAPLKSPGTKATDAQKSAERTSEDQSSTQKQDKRTQTQNRVTIRQEGVSASANAVVSKVIPRPQKLTETDQEYANKLTLFNKNLEKGKALHDALIQVVELGKSAKDKDVDDAFKARYSTDVKVKAKIPSNLSSIVPDPLGYTEYNTNTKDMEGKPAAYSNFVNAKAGVLIGGSNYANKEGEGPGVRLNNSEILFQQYRMGSNGNVKGLKEVVRSSIQNVDTMNIISMCHTKLADKNTEKEFKAGTDEFYALLATDNCKGVSFMLKDHPQAFGFKTISSIITGGESYIRIKLSTPEQL